MNLTDITLISISGAENAINNMIKVMEFSSKHINFGKLKILTCEEVKHDYIEIIKIPKLNKEQYTKFCINDLYKYIDTEFCLTVQWDGFIIDHSLWNNNFLNYDYIGAPWVFDVVNRIGNGGFSLRSKKFLAESSKLIYRQYQDASILNKLPKGSIIPEDWFMCCYCYDTMISNGIKFAPVNLAYNFSVEHPSNDKIYYRNILSTYRSFGFHGDFNIAAMELIYA